jgi:hypothetical protein
MKRCWISIVVGASCLAAASAAPGPKPDAGPVCLYESKAYSEGAFVCVQKSLMLTCVAEGAQMSWRPAPDKDINDRCTAPAVRHVAPEPRIHPHWHRYPVRLSHPLVENPAKCFIFNGVQYCE